MPKNTVTPFKTNTITLDSVRIVLNAWRLSKTNQNERIPKEIWEQIALLLNSHSEREIRSALSLTHIQMERGKQISEASKGLSSSSVTPLVEPIDFCEAQETQDCSYPLAYKPAEAFATNTSIVELRRPDGMLMKIHICTDRFEELLRAFFKG